ncbi:MAG: hypothetical protein ACKOUR_02495, partial [Planctomycetota bacterium]
TTHQRSSIVVLPTGRVDYDSAHEPQGIDGEVAFSSRDLFSSVKVSFVPPSAVRIDWLSMIATLGVGFSPTALRTT